VNAAWEAVTSSCDYWVLGIYWKARTCSRVNSSEYGSCTKSKINNRTTCIWKRRADKRENVQKDNQNLFKSINKRVASKIEVADWQLEVMVLGAEPVWIAFDMRELQRLQWRSASMIGGTARTRFWHLLAWQSIWRYALSAKMRFLVTDVAWSVYLSVCVLVCLLTCIFLGLHIVLLCFTPAVWQLLLNGYEYEWIWMCVSVSIMTRRLPALRSCLFCGLLLLLLLLTIIF